MNINRRIARLALPLILAAFALLSLVGCEGEPSETPTEQELPQILDDAMLAVKNAGSYKFTIDTNTVFIVNSGSELEDMSATMNITGIANVDDNEIQLIYDLNLSGYLFEYEEDLETFHGEIYVLVDWTYRKTNMPGDNEWIKMPSDVAYDQYNVIVNELALLESPEKIEFVEYEDFDGSECYVLKIVPNLENTQTWFSEHQMTADVIYWEEVEPYIGELSFTVWVDKDTSLVKKMAAAMLIDFDDPGDVPDFDTMTLDVVMEMKDYNKPVTINLPDEAANAVEM